MSGVIFDTGALIALDKGVRQIVVLIAEARRGNDTITVSAGCVAQAWRDPARQARVAGLLRQPNVVIVPIDGAEARRIGLLLAGVGGSDVVDAHVALCARRLDQIVFTSDPEDITGIDPTITTVRV